MLVKCKNALLLSDVASFSNMYRQLADEADVNLIVESEWNKRYRVNQEVVILGSKYLDNLNEAYYANAVIILKPGENPIPFVKMGVMRFIFDYHNQYELLTAFFRTEAITLHASNLKLQELLKECPILNFQEGEYDFKFDVDKFFYKGKPVYLADSQKRYLAEWLLNGHKDNSKRMILCNLRKKFGADFLKDVNRYGEIKEEKDE